MSSTSPYSAAIQNALTKSLALIAPSILEGAAKYITNPTAWDKMTEDTIQQLESGIPEMATSIDSQSPRHMILHVKTPTYHSKLRDSGLQTTVTYSWSTQHPTKAGRSAQTVLARFVPEVWFGASSIGSRPVLSATPSSGPSREEYSEELESIAAGMLTECLEDIIDEDGDDLGASFETALELMAHKCKQGSAAICQSMGASVIDGLDGEGDPYTFFFETDNCSLPPGDGASLSFTGHVTGEGWRNADDEKPEKFNLRPADWNFAVSAEEVRSAKNLL